jgi:hypothetical protein
VGVIVKSLASTPLTGSLKVTVKVTEVAVGNVPAAGAVEETEGAGSIVWLRVVLVFPANVESPAYSAVRL